jgi:hypothetical protein
MSGLFRAATGWIERNMSGGEEEKKEGVIARIKIQKSDPTQFEKAIFKAKEVRGWVEGVDAPAHRPVGEIFKKS